MNNDMIEKNEKTKRLGELEKAHVMQVFPLLTSSLATLACG